MIFKNLPVGGCWTEVCLEWFEFSNSRRCLETFIQFILAQCGFYLDYRIERFGRNESAFGRVLNWCGC